MNEWRDQVRFSRIRARRGSNLILDERVDDNLLHKLVQTATRTGTNLTLDSGIPPAITLELAALGKGRVTFLVKPKAFDQPLTRARSHRCLHRPSIHSGDEYCSTKPLCSSSLNSGHGVGCASAPSMVAIPATKSSPNFSQSTAAPAAAFAIEP